MRTIAISFLQNNPNNTTTAKQHRLHFLTFKDSSNRLNRLHYKTESADILLEANPRLQRQKRILTFLHDILPIHGMDSPAAVSSITKDIQKTRLDHNYFHYLLISSSQNDGVFQISTMTTKSNHRLYNEVTRMMQVFINKTTN